MTEELTARYGRSLLGVYPTPRLALTRGEGARVWDEDGHCYTDLFGGIAVNALGHAHPALVEAVTTQLQTLGHVSNFFATGPQVELAERLLALLGADGRVFLCNSGTEANEAAFKLTRRTGRRHLVAMADGFHGRTMGALAVTAKESHRAPFEPLPGEVTFVPYGDAAALEEAVTPETAAVVVEPLQGEAGVVVPPPGFLAEARRITAAHGALLWVDEVQTGIGRTGRWFAHQAEPALVDAPPDIVTLAKGLGGGVPVGATIATGGTAELLGPGSHGTTFGGNPVASAAALAVLDTIEREGLLAHASEVGARLTEILREPAPVARVRGAGLLLGCVLEQESAPAVVDAARRHGYLLNSTGPDTLRLAPPLTIGADLVEDFAGAWSAILAEGLGTGQS